MARMRWTAPAGRSPAQLARTRHLTKAESDAFNARLVVTLCNHIGDRAVLRAALEAAQ